MRMYLVAACLLAVSCSPAYSDEEYEQGRAIARQWTQQCPEPRVAACENALLVHESGIVFLIIPDDADTVLQSLTESSMFVRAAQSPQSFAHMNRIVFERDPDYEQVRDTYLDQIGPIP